MNTRCILNVIGLIIYSIISITSISMFYMKRSKFSIHARSPNLAIISGVCNYAMACIIFLSQIYSSLGKEFPCIIFLIISYLYPPIYALPYALRGWRLLVVYSLDLRQSYPQFGTEPFLMKVLAACTLFFIVLCGFISSQFKRYRKNRPIDDAKCVLFQEWYLFAGLLVFFIAALLFLSRKLHKVHDAFNINSELQACFLSWGIFAGPFFLYLILVEKKVIGYDEEHKFPMNYFILILDFITLIQTFVLPLARLKTVEKEKSQFRLHQKNSKHLEWNARKVVQNEATSHLLLEVAQKQLCVELFFFLRDVTEYEKLDPTKVDQIYKNYTIIVTNYILPNGVNQVNISDRVMKKTISQYEKNSFYKLEDGERLQIFRQASREVEKLIEENLFPFLKKNSDFLSTIENEEGIQEFLVQTGLVEMQTLSIRISSLEKEVTSDTLSLTNNVPSNQN